MSTVTVVIVNYKVAQLTIECLQSLEAEIASYTDARVVVVDNDSKDGSFEQIREAVDAENWRTWVDVVASDKNGGFAYGNNFGIKHMREAKGESDFYWFLNPDTKISKGALSQLVAFMQENPRAGICGSSIENDDGSLWPICFRFPGILSEFEKGIRLGIVTKLLSRWKVPRIMNQENTLVDWLPGASFIIRNNVFNDIGLMDDDYFLYYEETDFCLNAKRKGWECWYVPSSRIMHIAGASTGVVGETVKQGPLPQYVFDSRRRYFSKNYGFFYTALVDISWLIGYSLSSLRRAVFRTPNSDPENLLKDSFKNSVFFK